MGNLFKKAPVVVAPEQPKVPEVPALPPTSDKYVMLYSIAKGEMGQREISGSKHNPRILEYFKATSYITSKDETPWCAAFVNWCLYQMKEKGTNRADAVSFLKWGKTLSEPVKGCVLVLRHDNGGHHVTIFDHWEGNYAHCLGGNQGNRVCIAAYHKREIMKNGIRGF